MKLSPLQYALTSVGFKVDVTHQFNDPDGTSPFTKKAIDKGTKIYCKPMPQHRVAGASFANTYSAKAIYLNSRKMSRHKENNYLSEIIVEHESVHIEQADLLNEVYGKEIHPLALGIKDQFALMILSEAEAYGNEFTKACNDYKLTGNFNAIEQCRNNMDFAMRPSLRIDHADAHQAQTEIDDMITAKNETEVLKDFVLNFTQDLKAKKMVSYSTHYNLRTHLDNSPERNFFSYRNILGFDNPAEQVFVEEFGVEHIKSYMKKGKRDYFSAMNRDEKIDFAVGILDVTYNNLEPYEALVQQARSTSYSKNTL